MGMKAVEVRNLSVWVNGRAIVSGVDLDIEEGVVALITGSSGSGKTTLLKVLAGYIPSVYGLYSVSGSVKVLGRKPVDALLEGLIGYIPQDTWSFFIGYTICDELAALGLDGNWCSELCSTPMEMLSDGELYNSLLKLSLDLGARLVLVDEPSTHLDGEGFKQVMSMFRALASEHGITFVIADCRYWKYTGYADVVVELVKNTTTSNTPSRTITLCSTCRCGGVAVRVDDLWIRRGDRCVVKGLSLELREGEITALYGRNGAGKTTIIKALAGFKWIGRGSIKRFGSVFYIPQRPIYWFSASSVEEELKLYSKIYGRSADAVNTAVELFNLSRIIDRDPYTVSVGEARRLSLALSYIASPKILLIDEPTLGLDEDSSEILYSYLSGVRENCGCVVIATHDRGAVEFADRVVELKGSGVEVW